MKHLFIRLIGRKACIAALLMATKVRKERTYSNGTVRYRAIFKDRTSVRIIRRANGSYADIML